MPDLWTPADSHHLGVVTRKIILARTDRGVGADGKTFKPIKADGSPSKLRRTGRLMGSLQPRADAKGFAVTATAPYSGYVEEQGRPFMGVTPDEQATIDAAAIERLAARDAELNRKWKARARR